MLLPLLLAVAGCGDTWDKFMTPDFSWSHDRSLSADRVAGPAAGLGPAVPRSYRDAVRDSGGETRTAAAAAGCYRGRLTEEGNTCQAMRTDGGSLLTLAGPLRGFASGDSVCVCGVAAAQQFCHQGVTMLVRDISDTCADIR
jgi:hypothetical protein